MFDEIPIKSLRHLSQSTDSLNRSHQVTESMESLTDEGALTSDKSGKSPGSRRSHSPTVTQARR